MLSTILFDAVFNLLLDFLKPLEETGFKWFKMVNFRLLKQAYADDLTINTSSPEKSQIALNWMQTWLEWTVTMKAKPKKCISMAMKKFSPHLKSTSYVPFADTQYSPFDPKLSVKGVQMSSIIDMTQKDEFKQRHFKFLGRQIEAYLSETPMMERVKQKTLDDLSLVSRDPIRGAYKAWIYQHSIITRLSWPFFMHDFCRSFVTELQPTVNRYLRQWLGVYKSADEGVLYRSREHFGLNLTSITAHFESMQIVKCHLLKNSQDNNVRTLYLKRLKREEDFARWTATKHLNILI